MQMYALFLPDWHDVFSYEPGFDDYEAADKIWRESDSNVTVVRGCNLEGKDLEANGYGTEEEGFSWGEITKPAMGDWLFEEIENKKFEGKKRVQVSFFFNCRVFFFF